MLLNNRHMQLILIVSIVLLGSCSFRSTRPTEEERLILTRALDRVSAEYSNPRLVTGELTVKLQGIELLSGDALATSNRAKALNLDQPPSLYIWSSDIVDHSNQFMLSGSTIDPKPRDVFVDQEFDNNILFWAPSWGGSSEFLITRTFRYITFDYRPNVDREEERTRWNEIPLAILEKYTRSEPFLEQDDTLIDTVFAILENVADPVSQAEIIYNWVQSAMTYEYPPEQRGVRNAFETKRGDCGQYTALFMTMCRIAGIPARQQSGFNFVPENTGAHVWSEIYLPVKGWVPVDATRKGGFLFLDNKRLISSIGMNIPLKHAPQWATFHNSEVEDGKTDFMQMYTLVSSGVKAEFSSSRKVIRSVELN